MPAGKRPGACANFENSCVNRTRNIIGWKREKKSSIGFRTSFLRALT
jgi:hypothetical protein